MLTSLAVGLPVAVAARALLPGRRPLTLGTAAVLGVLGALAGAAVGRLLGDADPTAHPLRRELAGPLLGAALAVLAGWGVRARTYRSGPRPVRPRPWAEPFPDLPVSVSRPADGRPGEGRPGEGQPDDGQPGESGPAAGQPGGRRPAGAPAGPIRP
ncbi:GlsB/YeaQ/YmgE family stress response membrane protein [Parafrankia sp. FMc2]|uniref:GlsB/YeaQ/YmgE family stress response membrane protein n=1 Tax=Parafrankia sp. FMc2 TaxID=3233196 RepID=UPI0034D456F4